jgi:hypothetical protein
VAELADAQDLGSYGGHFRLPENFLSKSCKTLQNKAYKVDSTFAPRGKEWHERAFDLPIIAKWNGEMVRPLGVA